MKFIYFAQVLAAVNAGVSKPLDTHPLRSLQSTCDVLSEAATNCTTSMSFDDSLNCLGCSLNALLGCDFLKSSDLCKCVSENCGDCGSQMNAALDCELKEAGCDLTCSATGLGYKGKLTMTFMLLGSAIWLMQAV